MYVLPITVQLSLAVEIVTVVEIVTK